MKNIVLALFILGSCVKSTTENSTLTFKGSNTSNQFVDDLAKIYNKNRIKKINVIGGGSEEAIKDFINGDLFYLNSSRKLTDSEIESVEELQGKKVKEIIVALDAIAIIVNPRLGISELNLTEVGNILQGRIKNWKELGGPDLEITVYGRNERSGTYHFVKQKFAPEGFRSTIISKNNSNEIVRAVRSDLSSIAYVDLSSVSDDNHFPKDGIWAVNIKIEGGIAVSPFERMAVLNGQYPISRPLFQYIVDFKNDIINEFIKFELSEIGQDLIERKGFFKILPMHSTLNKQNGF